MAAERQSDKTSFDMVAHMKQRCVTEILHAKKIVPADIHGCLTNVHFSHGKSNMKDKPHSAHLPELANGSGYVEKKYFVAGNLLYQGYYTLCSCCSFHKNK